MQFPQNRPIGVFDSGFGGLTVLKELQRVLPSEDFIYLGDTARLPYGTKSRETILRYTRECCGFLCSQGVKLIVIACNTATALALDVVKEEFSIPIVGVIDPVIEHVHGNHIGVLATRATVQPGIYQTKIARKLPHAQVTAVAAPLLVSLVEEGFIDHPITSLAIEEYTRELRDIDTLILACTHFPLLKKQIEEKLQVPVIDPAIYTAQHVKKIVNSQAVGAGTTKFYVTDDMEKFKLFVENNFPLCNADVNTFCFAK